MAEIEDRASTAQTDSLELLEMFVRLMPDAAVVVDADGIIVATNELVEPIFGYGPTELVGHPIEMLVPERHRHAHRGHRAGYFASPKTRPMGAGLELTGRRRDGTEFPVDISLASISPDERQLVVAAIRDATARKAASVAHAQLAAIVQSSTDAIVSMSPEGEIKSWNIGAERLFGHRADDVIGSHISIVVPEDRSAELEELLAAAMTGTLVPPRDTVWLRADGAMVDVAMSVSPLSDRAHFMGFSILLRDITDRKGTEAELRRLFHEVQHRERWLRATAEIRLSMLDGRPVDDVLTFICAQGRELLQAREVCLVRPGVGAVTVVARSGVAADPADAELAEMMPAIRGILSERDARRRTTLETEGGVSIAVRIDVANAAAGVLVIGSVGADAVELDADALESVETLADQAALALELDRVRHYQEEMLLLGDRERIARDLHDLVIQRLFGTGMGLQAALRVIGEAAAADRVSTAIDDLDTTIRDIRSAIFELEPPPRATGGIRDELVQLANRASEGLGYAPSIRFSGPLDSAIDENLAHHLLAAAREALSNVARHANASSATVVVSVDHEVRLEVIDDGVGIGDTTRRSGLANLRQRAESFGGTSTVEPGVQGGSRFLWVVPVVPVAPPGGKAPSQPLGATTDRT